MAANRDGQVGEVTVVLAGDWSPLKQALDQATQAIQGTGGAFQIAGTAIDNSVTAPLGRAATAAKEATTALPSFYSGVETGGYKAVGAERAVRRLEMGLTSMALTSLGTQSGLAGVSARVAEASLLFGFGSAAVLALGGGFAAFGLVAKLLDAPLEAITKDAAEISAEFVKVATAAHPAIGAVGELLAVGQKLDTMGDEAQPTFLQQLFGTGLFGALGGGPLIEDRLEAERIGVASAEATSKGLKPMLEALVAIGHTKTLLQDVHATMTQLADVGQAGLVQHVAAAPHPGILGLDPAHDIPAHDVVTSTGLVGAFQTGLTNLRNQKNLPAAELTADTDILAKDFTQAVGGALKRAGDDLTPIDVLQGMYKTAAKAVRDSKVAPVIADELIAELQAHLLSAIDVVNRADGPVSLGLHRLATVRAPTMRPFAAQPAPLFSTGVTGLALPRADTFGLANPIPQALPPVTIPSAVGIQPKVTQAMTDEGKRLTEAVQLAPHDIEGEVTALDNLAKRHEHLNELLAAGVISQKTFDTALKEAQEQADHTTKTMIDLTGALGSAFASIGQAIGNSLAGAAGGLQNFGSLLFKIFGSLLSTVGQSLIAFGTAGIAIKSFISNPVLAIAAGAALIALGTALGSTATSAVSSAGSALATGGSYSGSGPGVYSSTNTFFNQPTPSTTLVINSRGGILNLNDPDTMDELQTALETLSGNRVTVQIGARGSS